MPIDPPQLAAWRKLCEEATPGPWELGPVHDDGQEWLTFDAQTEIYPPNGDDIGLDYQPGGPVAVASVREFPGNGLFIAAARTALPLLLDEVEALQAEVARLNQAATVKTTADRGAFTGDVICEFPNQEKP